jgi:hypothetical protein
MFLAAPKAARTIRRGYIRVKNSRRSAHARKGHKNQGFVERSAVAIRRRMTHATNAIGERIRARIAGQEPQEQGKDRGL